MKVSLLANLWAKLGQAFRVQMAMPACVVPIERIGLRNEYRTNCVRIAVDSLALGTL